MFNRQMLFILSLVLFMSLFLDANVYSKTNEKPECNADGITRNCDFFKERSNLAEIVLADGTRIRNPLYKGTAKDAPNGGLPLSSPSNGGANNYSNNNGYNQQSSGELDIYYLNQAEIFDVLEGSNLTTNFKLQFSNLASVMSINPELSVEFSWPPDDDKQAQKKKVKHSEIDTYLKENLSSERYLKLKEIIKKQASPLQMKIKEAQDQQQKIMLESKKRAEDIKKNVEFMKQRKTWIKVLYLYAQTKVIEMIKKGRYEANLSRAELSMIKKVQTITFTDLDSPKISDSSNCSGGAVNAFYSPINHSMNMCPGILMLPDPSLLFVIAHEIGHSIDPCSFQIPLMLVDSDKVNKFISESSFSKLDSESFKKLFPKDTAMMNLEPLFFINDSDQVSKMVEKGFLKVVDPGLNLKQYPFKSVVNCFVDKNHIHQVSKSDLTLLKELYKKNNYPSSPSEKIILENTKKRYFEAIDKYPQCFEALGLKTQLNETIADMIGTVVEEKYLSEHPPMTEEEKVSAFFGIADTCNEDPKILGKPKSYAPRIIESGFINSLILEHPKDEDRIEKIMMNSPEMEKIFACKRTVPACFDSWSLVNNSTPSRSQIIKSETLGNEGGVQ